MIHIVIPTIQGREGIYHTSRASYSARTEAEHSIYVAHDLPTCGEAWNLGWQEVRRVGQPGDYVHLTCDDILPEPGWDAAARRVADTGKLPACKLLYPDGRVCYWGDSFHPIPDMTPVARATIMFFPWELAQKVMPCIPVHYFSDDWLSWAAAMEGYPAAYAEGYTFTHLWAQHGRGAGMTEDERMEYDRPIFEAAKREWEEKHGA